MFYKISCSVDKMDGPSPSCNIEEQMEVQIIFRLARHAPHVFSSLYHDVTSTRRLFYIAQVLGTSG
jgi:hypothetical protein